MGGWAGERRTKGCIQHSLPPPPRPGPPPQSRGLCARPRTGGTGHLRRGLALRTPCCVSAAPLRAASFPACAKPQAATLLTVKRLFLKAARPRLPPAPRQLSRRTFSQRGPGQGGGAECRPARGPVPATPDHPPPGCAPGELLPRLDPLIAFFLQRHPHSPFSPHGPYLSQESPDSTTEPRVLICMPLPPPHPQVPQYSRFPLGSRPSPPAHHDEQGSPPSPPSQH